MTNGSMNLLYPQIVLFQRSVLLFTGCVVNNSAGQASTAGRDSRANAELSCVISAINSTRKSSLPKPHCEGAGPLDGRTGRGTHQRNAGSKGRASPRANAVRPPQLAASWPLMTGNRFRRWRLSALSVLPTDHNLSWSRLSEQNFRVDKWSLCRG
jgi:hypothetical protein